MTLLLLAVLGACARPGSPTAAGSPGTGIPTGSPTAAAPQPTLPLPSEPGQPGGTPDAVDASGCHTNLQVNEGSTGKNYCVKLGGTVTVALHGQPGQLWRPVVVTGDALTAAPGTPAVGAVLTDTYHAERAGTTTLTSSRPACPPAKPGNLACMSMEAFTVTIQVR